MTNRCCGSFRGNSAKNPGLSLRLSASCTGMTVNRHRLQMQMSAEPIYSSALTKADGSFQEIVVISVMVARRQARASTLNSHLGHVIQPFIQVNGPPFRGTCGGTPSARWTIPWAGIAGKVPVPAHFRGPDRVQHSSMPAPESPGILQAGLGQAKAHVVSQLLRFGNARSPAGAGLRQGPAHDAQSTAGAQARVPRAGLIRQPRRQSVSPHLKRPLVRPAHSFSLLLMASTWGTPARSSHRLGRCRTPHPRCPAERDSRSPLQHRCASFPLVRKTTPRAPRPPGAAPGHQPTPEHQFPVQQPCPWLRRVF